LSPPYMIKANPICLLLFIQEACCALALAFAKAGNSIAAKIAMIAITTNSSISVKAVKQQIFLSFIESNSDFPFLEANERIDVFIATTKITMSTSEIMPYTTTLENLHKDVVERPTDRGHHFH
jgi:hypothetical protein